MIRQGKLRVKTIKLYDTDTIIEMAVKIWVSFEIGQSCTIKRYENCYCVQDATRELDIPTGEFVIEELIKIIKEEVCKTNVNQVRRSRGPNTELGVEESKLFRYNQDAKTGFVTIWRVR